MLTTNCPCHPDYACKSICFYPSQHRNNSWPRRSVGPDCPKCQVCRECSDDGCHDQGASQGRRNDQRHGGGPGSSNQNQSNSGPEIVKVTPCMSIMSIKPKDGWNTWAPQGTSPIHEVQTLAALAHSDAYPAWILKGTTVGSLPDPYRCSLLPYVRPYTHENRGPGFHIGSGLTPGTARLYAQGTAVFCSLPLAHCRYPLCSAGDEVPTLRERCCCASRPRLPIHRMVRCGRAAPYRSPPHMHNANPATACFLAQHQMPYAERLAACHLRLPASLRGKAPDSLAGS